MNQILIQILRLIQKRDILQFLTFLSKNGYTILKHNTDNLSEAIITCVNDILSIWDSNQIQGLINWFKMIPYIDQLLLQQLIEGLAAKQILQQSVEKKTLSFVISNKTVIQQSNNIKDPRNKSEIQHFDQNAIPQREVSMHIDMMAVNKHYIDKIQQLEKEIALKNQTITELEGKKDQISQKDKINMAKLIEKDDIIATLKKDNSKTIKKIECGYMELKPNQQLASQKQHIDNLLTSNAAQENLIKEQQVKISYLEQQLANTTLNKVSTNIDFNSTLNVSLHLDELEQDYIFVRGEPFMYERDQQFHYTEQCEPEAQNISKFIENVPETVQECENQQQVVSISDFDTETIIHEQQNNYRTDTEKPRINEEYRQIHQQHEQLPQTELQMQVNQLKSNEIFHKSFLEALQKSEQSKTIEKIRKMKRLYSAHRSNAVQKPQINETVDLSSSFSQK